MANRTSMKEYLKTLPSDYIVEVYDDKHHIVYHGEVRSALGNPIVLRYPVTATREEEFMGIDGKPGTRVLINANRGKKLNSSVKSGLVAEILDTIDREVNVHTGASAAYVAASLDMEEDLDLITMLAQATGKYDIYTTASGYFQDEDYIITRAGNTVEKVLGDMGMAVPDDLKKL